MSSQVELKKFLKWASDKISVVWCDGALCNTESLKSFSPRSNESIEGFLSRVVDCVNRGEYVFHFFNDFDSDEYDEYQEETMNVSELIECYRVLSV